MLLLGDRHTTALRLRRQADAREARLSTLCSLKMTLVCMLVNYHCHSITNTNCKQCTLCIDVPMCINQMVVHPLQ